MTTLCVCTGKTFLDNGVVTSSSLCHFAERHTALEDEWKLLEKGWDQVPYSWLFSRVHVYKFSGKRQNLGLQILYSFNFASGYA